jgi:lipopolysaccharide kinase (Kdo/WaaP) family protein
LRLRLVVPGYEDLKADHASGLVITECKHAIESILSSGTLYEFAQKQPTARVFSGRAPVYAVEIPGCGSVVVRHAMRGGVIGKTGTDLFLPPTRALRELVNSFRLRAAGVPTPHVIAYATYTAGWLFRRADVVTREVAGADIASLASSESAVVTRKESIDAIARLVALLTAAGAHHPDLNAKNILLSTDDSGATVAWVLDVDRIRFHVPGDPMITEANLTRLFRSFRKWQDKGLPLFDAEGERELTARTIERTP